MPPALRKGSFLDRAINGSRSQGVPPIDTTFFRGPQGVPALFKPEQEQKAYGDNVHLYRSVLTISMEIGSTDFKLKKTRDDGELEYVTRHQALETMKTPQPIEGGKSMLTGMLLKVVTGMHLMLNGEAFWLLTKRLKANGVPTYIMPLLPQFMRVNISDDGEVMQYTYRLPTGEFRLDPMDVVHFRMPDPTNPYRGHSPVQGIRYAIDTNKQADIMNFHRMENNAVPDGIVTSENAVSEAQTNLIRAEWRQMHSGPSNAGRFAVMPKGMDFKTVQQTNQEIQYAEGKAMMRDEVLTAYGVGMEILGKTESQTRANADTAVFIFEKYGVNPYLRLFNDTLQNDYRVAFPGTEKLEYCYDERVPQNLEEKRLNFQAGFAIGAVTPNEYRKAFGWEAPDLPGMDVPYLDLGKMPVGEERLPPADAPIDDPPLDQANIQDDQTQQEDTEEE